MYFTQLGGLSPEESTAWATWAQAGVTFIGIVVAVFGILWQLRKQWLLHSANLIATLDERFHSPEFRRLRVAGQSRLSSHVDNCARLDLSNDLPVLGFFENVAYLARRRALDKKMVWNKFGWYVVGYYLAITRWKDANQKNAIEQYREKEKDETLYEEFVWLYVQCVEIYRKRGVPVYNCCWQKTRIEHLLDNEGSLLNLPPLTLISLPAAGTGTVSKTP
jgi:hypothetical protein